MMDEAVGVRRLPVCGLLLCAGMLSALSGCAHESDPSGSGPAGDSEATPAESSSSSQPGANQPGANQPGDDGPATSQPVPADGKPPVVDRRPQPLLDGWPQPAAALLLSGEQHGYLEPCGCTETQSGGVSRRYDLVRQLKQRGWSVAGLDLGGSVRRNRRQNQIKFETLLSAWNAMAYQAVGLGPDELRFGPDYLLSQHAAAAADDAQEVAFVSANVTFYSTPDLGTPARMRKFEVNGVRVAVTGVIGQSVSKSVYPQGAQVEVTFEEPAQAIQAVLPQMRAAKPDLMVLLSFAKMPESRALAEKFPDFDVILTAGGVEDPRGKPQMVGQTWLIDVGHKGKSVGVLGVFPDAQPRLRFELVDLDKQRFADSESMVELMKFYQERLRDERIVLTELPIQPPGGGDARYVGAQACGECHTRAYEKWKATPHAHAYESLKQAHGGFSDHVLNRVFDPECLACHVTGWAPQRVLRFRSGFINREFLEDELKQKHSKQLQGQQCESCHGPGSRHIELIAADQIKQAAAQVRVTLKTAQEKTCIGCHDLDNSPHFEFDTYWKQVAHPWRD